VLDCHDLVLTGERHGVVPSAKAAVPVLERDEDLEGSIIGSETYQELQEDQILEKIQKIM
jgi:hypothetical protein